MLLNLVIKVGNQPWQAGLKDGMPICVLPVDEPLSDRMKKTFAIVTIRDSLWSAIESGLAPITIDVGAELEEVKWARSRYVDMTSLATALGDTTLVDQWRGGGVVSVQDGIDLNSGVFLDSTPLNTWPYVDDENAVTAGSYTVGSGGDYSNWTAAFGDIGTPLTGDLTLTQISDTVETVASQNTNLGGFTLTLDSDTPPAGDPTQGWVCTGGVTTSSMFALRASGSGLFEVKNLRLKRTGGTGALLAVTTAGPDINFHDTIVEVGTCTVMSIMVYDDSGASGSTDFHVWNVLGFNDGGSHTRHLFMSIGYSAVVVTENCTFIGGADYGIDAGGSSAIIRNCVSVGSGSLDYRNTNGATGRNNASEDGTAADGNWTSGTGNITGITPSAEFESLDPSQSDFAQVVTGGSLADAGDTVQIAGNIAGIRGTERPHDSLYSIGADERYIPPTVRAGLQGKQVQLDVVNFDRALGPTEETVQQAMERLDESALTKQNKGMAAEITTADGDVATLIGMVARPNGYVIAKVNGASVKLADGPSEKATSFCYFSGDGGTTARAIADVTVGDKLYWNGSVSNYQLDDIDRIDFEYEV